MISFEEMNKRVWNLPCEIFAPCAASRLVSREQIDEMISTGLEVISSGANVPFADKEIFFGPIMEYADNYDLLRKVRKTKERMEFIREEEIWRIFI